MLSSDHSFFPLFNLPVRKLRLALQDDMGTDIASFEAAFAQASPFLEITGVFSYWFQLLNGIFYFFRYKQLLQYCHLIFSPGYHLVKFLFDN